VVHQRPSGQAAIGDPPLLGIVQAVGGWEFFKDYDFAAKPCGDQLFYPF
jgi:hypothetical protein